MAATMLMQTGVEDAASTLVRLAVAIAGVGAATLLGAWYFQFGLGLAPCPLCLEQRWPYYLAVPVAALLAVGAARSAPRGMLVAGFAAVALLMLWGAGLGFYHAGAEWKWWAGPQDCAGSGAPSGGAGDLLRRMQTTRVVRCDEAAWRDPVLDLSLAGWNVLISLALLCAAVLGLRDASKRG
jgi:disulfide bond formation protein DsbB